MIIKRENGETLVLTDKEIDHIIDSYYDEGGTEQPKESFKRWRANGEFYFRITAAGMIGAISESGVRMNDFDFESGNYFETREAAEQHRDKIVFIQKYKDRILELNEDKKMWIDSVYSNHWLLQYNREGRRITVCCNYKIQHSDIGFYFKSQEIGELLIKEFTQEDLIKYLFS